jgi:hypothetical protein
MLLCSTKEVDMSIISGYEMDNSPALAKRFASIARTLFDHKAVADREAVPLENLYRLLEMFRYGSFADDQHRGVLALEGLDAHPMGPLEASPWHNSIETALQAALTETFGNAKKDEAIDQLQAGISGLVRGEDIPEQVAIRAKGFFAAFEARV